MLAMVGARSAAMGFNRVIDKMIDKKNPRTANRAIPAGLLSSKEVLLFIVRFLWCYCLWATFQARSVIDATASARCIFSSDLFLYKRLLGRVI